MITKVFSVYDSKSEAFGRPMFAGTKGLALRSFTEISNDSGSEIGKYPADFTLFELGEYDDSNGSFNLHSTPISLGIAQEFVNLK